MIRVAPMTGSGIASTTAIVLGMNASIVNGIPMHLPTLRDAAPVIWVTTVEVDKGIFGTVHVRPDRMFPTLFATTATWVIRKSVARGLRHDTR